MNHAISNQNNHHFRAPKPDSHSLSSREVGKATVFRNSRQSGGLEVAIYNSLHLKDSPTAEYSNAKQAESWINAWILWSQFPLYLSNSPYSPNKGESPCTTGSKQLCAPSPSHYCSLQLNNNVTAVTQNSCPQKVYFHGPVRAYHPWLPAQCHIYLSCCSGLLKVSRGAVVACKGKIVNPLPPDYFCSF